MTLDVEGLRARLPELLPDWLPNQRWFGGKGRPVTSYEAVSVAPVGAGDPALVDVLVRVVYDDGDAEHYQLLLGLRSPPVDHLEHALLGQVGDRWCYDAPHDRELMGALLGRLHAGRPMGALRFGRLADFEFDEPLPSRPMTGEQSNTSVVFADAYILKLFRKVAPGVNPELEVTKALAAVGCTNIVPPLGWIEGRLEDESVTLGLLQPFLRSATDGWAMATTSVRDLYAEGDLHADEVGGDFAAEATRLGAATAAVHVDLARALPTVPGGPEQAAEIAHLMAERLAAAITAVSELAPYAEGLRAAYDELAARPGPLLLQRVHGDYHLGQVLRTDAGWVLLDFEGEPARPLGARRAPDSPMRDVAGMLRSFDYAARLLLADHPGRPNLVYRAGEWAGRNREAFCAGYVAGGGTDPGSEAVLLRAFELDKAVYEVVYEARNRPHWISIPLGSIERLVS